MLAIEVRWLTGEYIAQEHETAPEWPPHPARLLYALIEAWHVGGRNASERRALEWMETAGAPAIEAPARPTRESYRTYVPMGSKAHRAGEPPRWDRKPKLRASTYVGDEAVRFIWDGRPQEAVLDALRQLCGRVTRLGAAASFAEISIGEVEVAHRNAWRPNKYGRTPVRVPARGTVDASDRIPPSFPGRSYPHTLAWYEHAVETNGEPGTWLGLRSGPAWPIERGPALARAIRNALTSTARSIGEPARAIVHGHEAAGDPLRKGHIRILPLAHVGGRYGSGRVLGAAILLPPDTPEDDEAHVDRITRAWLAVGGSASALGDTVQLEPGDSRSTVQPRCWTAPADIWQTVIPLELDRYVQAGSRMRRRGWNDSEWKRAEGLVRRACRAEGLPEPVTVELSRTPFAVGSPHASRMRREQHHDRPLIHARITLPEAVRGPLVIGRGRHLGYGLMAPLRREE